MPFPRIMLCQCSQPQNLCQSKGQQTSQIPFRSLQTRVWWLWQFYIRQTDRKCLNRYREHWPKNYISNWSWIMFSTLLIIPINVPAFKTALNYYAFKNKLKNKWIYQRNLKSIGHQKRRIVNFWTASLPSSPVNSKIRLCECCNSTTTEWKQGDTCKPSCLCDQWKGMYFMYWLLLLHMREKMLSLWSWDLLEMCG